MKRFYQTVTSAPEEDGFSIRLDGKPVLTPSRQSLLSPTQKFADAIVSEWEAQIDVIDPETMPLTQILTTAMDCAVADRAAIEAEVLRYLDTDLLLYRAKEPEAIVKLQHDIWDPWVQWFERLGVCKLLTTKELKALKQSDAAHHYAEKIVKRADTWHFTALQMVTAMSGSIILALAFIEGAASADDVFQAAQLEEVYRSDFYNEDFYGKAPHQEKAQAGMMRDLMALKLFLDTVTT
jgi:chaperone required for assembly of F1-ATPase